MDGTEVFFRPLLRALEGEHLALDSNPAAAARRLSKWIGKFDRPAPVDAG